MRSDLSDWCKAAEGMSCPQAYQGFKRSLTEHITI